MTAREQADGFLAADAALLSAAEALGYVLGLPGVSTAVVGCRTPAEVDENARIARAFAPFDERRTGQIERRTARHAAAFTAYKRPESTHLG